MMRPMINCREFEDFVLAYLEGELPWYQLAMFRFHLAMCSECRRYLAAYQSAQTLTVGAFDEEAPVPQDVPEDLVKAVIAALNVDKPES